MTIDNTEWGRRFVARIVERSGASEEAAQMTLDAVPMSDWRDGEFDEDPEGAAEEEMSNWDDDGYTTEEET